MKKDKPERQYTSSGSFWEEKVGYSRAIKCGPFVFVSGTTAIDAEGLIVGKSDPYKQTFFIYKKIEQALLELDSSLDEITRVVIYTTNIQFWELIGKAHKKFMDKVKPATTLVEVSNLVHHEMMVEIEVTAISSA